ncbi:uncharacterized protein C4orf17 homolog isoform X2 [Antechinus flavipes]|uniref:uncharacterized protein C4orf17 homolog isoform X2 n=1 Tax=Antechinus flavipes TaxID=38775 RepID=UPI0022368A98|nr:uncharacterized protein C4orf17 homolog isoform X2 [Antechinus flavipes]XP_051819944.1 uncharacterized protein C4orf17 homolog isoform X2 [Antechinus flavipes]XP_051819945.1 uncharacterized protein C4orf17 homolog isoform X2 [Antechinus flavipes]
MNINFRSQFDPLLGHDTSLMTRNANCFLVRHTPHPRRVCHIKGLNNIPICAVNDESFFKALYDASQLGTADKDTPAINKVASANNIRSFHNPGSNKMKMLPRPNSEPCKQTEDFFDDPSDGALKIKKEELRGRSYLSNSKANKSLMVSEHNDSKKEMRSKTICIPNYLDQEIKILSKLCEILQTDSLAVLLEWLLQASVQEKEWVSALIHSELSEINLLKNREPIPQKKSGKEKSFSSVKTGMTPFVESKTSVLSKEEMPKVNRVQSQKLEKYKEPRQESEEKPGLIKEANKFEELIEEYFSNTKTPAKNLKIWERNYCPSLSSKSNNMKKPTREQFVFPKTQ